MNHLDALKTANERDERTKEREREKPEKKTEREKEEKKDGLRGGIGYRN